MPYGADSYELFLRLQGFPNPVLLESLGAARSMDVLAALPVSLLSCHNWDTRTDEILQPDPFTAIRQALQRFAPTQPCPEPLPFTGGAIGFLGYELNRFIHPGLHRETSGPDMLMGMYDVFIVVDHRQQRSLLVGTPQAAQARYDAIRRSLELIPETPTPLALTGALKHHTSPAEYRAAFERIQDYILNGDCYQVNLTQCFEAPYSGHPLALYRKLSQLQQADFSAYLGFESQQILSFSPERLVRRHGDSILAEPIKGTRRRDPDPLVDQALAQELTESAKDQAENLMIVDLLRNDLGRCAEPGSVTVSELFGLRSYPNVHHLVSQISARARPDFDATRILQHCFPGGSVTGAPKLRAMQIIRELEPHARQVYCGAIGYLGFDGNMDTNLPIRTLLCEQGQLRYWAGGGLVADSDPEAEFEESLTKVNFITNQLIKSIT
ncbi:MAG: aminodeoxychorismate synthase component I [Pseudomonadales bacterium]|nr:aminodeoxychorismate synthase component I [Pseudomonadales bacterium]